jgi:DNA mismatch repair ATPase MutS
MNNVIGNDLLLQDEERVLILTGPNMGGKSTLLRQTCLLAIMSQIGCYVPAKNYETIIFDQIFCRIGASDRII